LAPARILDSGLEFSAHHPQHRYVCHAAIAFTIVMTWVFNNTKGSVFIAVLVHASFDMVLSIINKLFSVPIVNDYGSNVPVLMGLGVLALVLVALTRGRLAYQRYREEVLDPATAPT
jgi:hypothetical protein